jgi:prepilin-type N-terminal cleavage/methylation domain-containing protein
MKGTLQKGFTLIEMLIVITIIGIIVGIGVPALRDAKQKAAQAKVDSVIATIATAKARYTLDNSDSAITTFNGADAADGTSAGGTRFTALKPYILVKGVQVADVPTLLNGTGLSNLTIGTLNVGNTQGTAPNVN